jgi:hypothetical protein
VTRVVGVFDFVRRFKPLLAASTGVRPSAFNTGFVLGQGSNAGMRRPYAHPLMNSHKPADPDQGRIVAVCALVVVAVAQRGGGVYSFVRATTVGVAAGGWVAVWALLSRFFIPSGGFCTTPSRNPPWVHFKPVRRHQQTAPLELKHGDHDREPVNAQKLRTGASRCGTPFGYSVAGLRSGWSETARSARSTRCHRGPGSVLAGSKLGGSSLAHGFN